MARNDQGAWVAGFYGKMPRKATCFEAELEGVFHGLKLIRERGWNNATVESDSLTVVSILNDRNIHASTWAEAHPRRVLIEDCLGLMKDTGATVIHTLREGNRCADTMAKMGGLQTENFRVVTEPPEEVRDNLAEDVMGVAFPRGYM